MKKPVYWSDGKPITSPWNKSHIVRMESPALQVMWDVMSGPLPDNDRYTVAKSGSVLTVTMHKSPTYPAHSPFHGTIELWVSAAEGENLYGSISALSSPITDEDNGYVLVYVVGTVFAPDTQGLFLVPTYVDPLFTGESTGYPGYGTLGDSAIGAHAFPRYRLNIYIYASNGSFDGARTFTISLDSH